MDERRKTARVAGLLYLVTIVTGVFSLLYVPSQINVHGDAAATVHNIVAFETMFRLGIAVGSIGYVAFLLLPFALYKLLSPVNRDAAVLMTALAVTCVPMDFLAIANQLDILSLLKGDKHQHGLPLDQVQAGVMSLLDAYSNKVFISELFWGLWLLPFGYLVFKSGFLPKILGVFLMMGCFSYLTPFFGQTLFPHLAIPGFVMLPASLGEMGICVWLLIFSLRRVRPGGG